MNSRLTVEQVLDLMESLKAAVRDFAAREEKLEQDFRTRMGAAERQRDEAAEAISAQLTADLATADAELRSGRESADAARDRRQKEINEGQKQEKKKSAEEIDHKEGSRKHKLQTETLQGTRNRETGLTNAEHAFDEFKHALAAEQESLAALEVRAQKSFRGYGRFSGLLAAAQEQTEPGPAADEYQLLEELRGTLAKSREQIARFRKLPFPWFFRFLPVWLLLVFCQLGAVPLLQQLGIGSFTYQQATLSVAGCVVVGLIFLFIGRSQAGPRAQSIARALGRARRLHGICLHKATLRHTQEIERIEHDFENLNQWVEQEWNNAIEEAARLRDARPREIDEETARRHAENDRQHRDQIDSLQKKHAEAEDRLKQEAERRKQENATRSAEKIAQIRAEHQAQWTPLEADWKGRLQPLYQTIQETQAEADRLFPPWNAKVWEQWTPPEQFSHAARFGRMEVDVEKLAERLPNQERLALPGPARFAVPLLLNYPQQGSLLFETNNSGRDEMISALNNIVLRLLSTAPPGRLSFTVIDPVGLGQNFSGVMHLADYAEHVINSRIWTQPAQIEQRLADLNEHMEKVIQMYLRNEYATIAEYNEQAGNIAEKYHFVVVADFPSAFSDAAARRLLSIAASGARCGVFTLIHWDRRQPAPQDFVPEEFRKSSVGVTCKGNNFVLAGRSLPGTQLVLDAAPDPDFTTDFIHKVGVSSRDSNRVEVPFSQIAPAESERWSVETTNELRVPIGRTGATKLQYLAIGKGTRQHALVAGKTGSGKSTLFHVMITNLALWCSPEQVEFYLIDFKKGVEFKCYATHRLPHARVVAIESDREFGLSVLQRLDDELKRRGDMFRRLGVQDIAGYQRAGGTEPVPRSLLIIDEFQEFFVEDDKIAQTASLLLDRIVRQGRAFGIHVLLGSQTLGGAYTVARTTLGQMVIRIALQCNEADAYLIMDDNNPAPRLLSRPGEGIYNDTAGTLEGNSPFQVVWLPDEVRDERLAEVRQLADARETAYPGPIVFEGNAPSDVRENEPLRTLLHAPSIREASAVRVWLGAPNSIKGPTEAVFQPQSGNNLLMVGQRDEAILSIFSIGLISLAAQFPAGRAKFILCDGSGPETPPRQFLDRVVDAIPRDVITAKQGDLPEILSGLAEELKRRSDDADAAEAPPTFLFIHGLQKFNKLRYEEDFGFSSGDSEAPANPAALLNTLICERTRFGFHVIASCDSFNNVNRFLSRKALTEFELRVLFQMSANDSASLIDSPKASMLGLHRALFYNQQEGYLETFRPYALPGIEWVEEAGRQLSRLRQA